MHISKLRALAKAARLTEDELLAIRDEQGKIDDRGIIDFVRSWTKHRNNTKQEGWHEGLDSTIQTDPGFLEVEARDELEYLRSIARARGLVPGANKSTSSNDNSSPSKNPESDFGESQRSPSTVFDSKTTELDRKRREDIQSYSKWEDIRSNYYGTKIAGSAIYKPVKAVKKLRQPKKVVQPKQGKKKLVGACAKHAAKLFCSKGHPFSGDNLRINPKGFRVCKTCQRDYGRKSISLNKQSINKRKRQRWAAKKYG